VRACVHVSKQVSQTNCLRRRNRAWGF